MAREFWNPTFTVLTGTTVTEDVPLTPSARAEISALPRAIPVTTPAGLTAAMLGLELLHEKLTPVMTAPRLSLAIAES
jgi:hypothetical protein